TDRLFSRQQLLASINRAEEYVTATRVADDYRKHQRKALDLLTSKDTKSAFDLRSESPALLEKYGPGINATSMIMARRLVEAGVPFITVFWKGDPKTGELCKSGGGWDTHGNNFNCLKDRLLPEFDRPFAALLDDLHQRGLLDETLVIVSSEMGRKPKIGDPRSGGVSGAGRDHWTRSMSILLAGGGIRGGQAYGATDRFAEFPAVNPVAPEDIAKTVFHSMGIDDLNARDREGRPFQLMEAGKVIEALF
ncbi:MAG TPA: DUF1501 domain-containing protein, partial [Pirellulaceae bacterium]|nr:DUF1501 domain-containing protein [Pirellulaceae bacterium]